MQIEKQNPDQLQCEICKMPFRRESAFDNRMRTHNEPDNFRCDIGGNIFARLQININENVRTIRKIEFGMTHREAVKVLKVETTARWRNMVTEGFGFNIFQACACEFIPLVNKAQTRISIRTSTLKILFFYFLSGVAINVFVRWTLEQINLMPRQFTSISSNSPLDFTFHTSDGNTVLLCTNEYIWPVLHIHF